MASRQMTWQEARTLTSQMENRIVAAHRNDGELIRVWGIPRGGGYVVALLSGGPFQPVERPEDAVVAVDDIIDTGRTAEGVQQQYGLDTYALVDRFKEPDRWSNRWIVFPWEGVTGQEDDGRHIVTRMLQIIGEDPKRPGLLDTPRRVVETWGELFEGYAYTKADLTEILTRFEGPVVPVTVSGISFVSTCEHHLLPYRGTVDIKYTPEDGVIGLSKLPRMVQLLARGG